MKNVTFAFIILALLGCTKSETETLLVCEGDMSDPLNMYGGKLGGEKERDYFTITKIGDTVTKVKTDRYTYTPKRVDVSTKENKGPIYIFN